MRSLLATLERHALPLIVLSGCLLAVGPGAISRPVEHALREVPLVGPAAHPRAELSGLAWHGDTLVLLPQFPARAGPPGAAAVYGLDRGALEAFVAGDPAPLAPRAIPFDDAGAAAEIEGFEGFEAIAFSGGRVFLTVEADPREGTVGWLVGGRVRGPLEGIALDPALRVELPRQTEVDNLAYEAIVVREDRVFVLHEANGAPNAAPRAAVFDLSLRPLPEAAMAQLEYRLTDATGADPSGRVWVTNYFYGEDEWPAETCRLFRRFGVGRSHASSRTVERLVELAVDARGVSVTGAEPILLALPCGVSRNWEGIERLGDGFIVATDEHPRTIVGYVSAGR